MASTPGKNVSSLAILDGPPGITRLRAPITGYHGENDEQAGDEDADCTDRIGQRAGQPEQNAMLPRLVRPTIAPTYRPAPMLRPQSVRVRRT